MKRKYYHKFKKHFCENLDGRLGFECTTTIEDSCMLTVDHNNADRNDNSPENLVTLCACCHNYKTKIFRDSIKPKKKK
jgi:5-methylcytosine-specific restriction endonuclease McrA